MRRLKASAQHPGGIGAQAQDCTGAERVWRCDACAAILLPCAPSTPPTPAPTHTQTPTFSSPTSPAKMRHLRPSFWTRASVSLASFWEQGIGAQDRWAHSVQQALPTGLAKGRAQHKGKDSLSHSDESRRCTALALNVFEDELYHQRVCQAGQPSPVPHLCSPH